MAVSAILEEVRGQENRIATAQGSFEGLWDNTSGGTCACANLEAPWRGASALLQIVASYLGRGQAPCE